MRPIHILAVLAFPLACVAAQELAASAAIRSGDSAGASTCPKWSYQLSQGPGKERGTITFGPITAIYEGAASRDVASTGGGPYDMDPNGSTGFGESNLGERITSDRRRVVFSYLGRTFSVLKPGDSLVVGGKTYAIGTGTVTIRFGQGGKTSVTITPPAEGAATR